MADTLIPERRLRTGRGPDAATIQDLKAQLRGEVIGPEEAGYDAARRVWNGMIDRRPALIARCAGAADVIRGVTFARERDLVLSVRGGGHNVTGNAVCEDGLMLDLSPMKGIRVDPARRAVRAEAGVTWGELDHETQAFGLATTGGQVSTTGIAGLTLGGGIGWLMRKHGLTIDNLLTADIVTADGHLRTVGTEEDPDLFWAIRGGGGNFGVVTSFEYRLHPVGPLVTGGMALYPVAKAKDVLRFYRELMATGPDELTVVVAFMTAPPAPFVPAPLVGSPLVGLALCHLGTPAEGQRVIDRIRAFSPPPIDLLGPLPYTALQRMTDAALPFGRQVYLKSSHLTSLADEVIDTIVRGALAVTSPQSLIVLVPYGGAVARVAEDATAFSHRDTAHDVVAFAIWDDPGDGDRHIEWGQAFGAAVRPFARGVYVNEMGLEGEERVREAYSPTTYRRLAALKQRYDPTNFFRLNQNIQPAD